MCAQVETGRGRKGPVEKVHFAPLGLGRTRRAVCGPGRAGVGPGRSMGFEGGCGTRTGIADDLGGGSGNADSGIRGSDALGCDGDGGESEDVESCAQDGGGGRGEGRTVAECGGVGDGNGRRDGCAGEMSHAAITAFDGGGKNVGALCVVALVRLLGRRDATAEAADTGPWRWTSRRGLGRRCRGALESCRIPVRFLPFSGGGFANDVGGGAPKPLPGGLMGPDTGFVVWLFQCFHCLETWGRDPCSPGPAP